LIVSIFSMFVSCTKENSQANLRIAVAANFYPVMLDLKKDFEEEYSIQVDLISGASGVLSSQIRQGAPFDVFFSADLDYSTDLYEDGFARKGPAIYAKGQMVLCSKASLVDSVALCSTKGLGKIGIANPKTAPYGKAALAFLKELSCFERLEPKLVFANNINQLDQYISNGVVSVGITAASSIEMKSFLNKYTSIQFSEGLEQSCIVIDGKQAVHPLSQKFIDFILSERIQKSIVSKGYRL
jgi:molybdate transport system substrate-binding protein